MSRDFLYFDHYACTHARRQLELYAKVARDKLLTAFSNIEEEAREYANGKLENTPVGPDGGDYEAALERAYDAEIEFSLELQEVAEAVFAFATAGLYHLFEKQISKFLMDQLREADSPPRVRVWADVENCLREYGVEVTALPLYSDLNELRNVANTVKHGDGASLQALRDTGAVVLNEPSGARTEGIGLGVFGSEFSILGVPLYLTIHDFDRYLAAVTGFWNHDRWLAAGERFYKQA